MLPVKIDVFYPVPEGWGFCSTCEMMLDQANLGEAPHERGLDEYPPEWQAEFRQLSVLVFSLADKYKDRVKIHIWDPRSLQGIFKSIRHGVRRYPTFLVNGGKKITGWETEKLEQHIQSAMKISDSEI